MINLPDGLQKATSVQQSQWWESDFIKSLTECDILRGTRMTLENELKILTDYAKEAKSMLERNIATVQKGIELLQLHIIEVKRNFERYNYSSKLGIILAACSYIYTLADFSLPCTTISLSSRLYIIILFLDMHGKQQSHAHARRYLL